MPIKISDLDPSNSITEYDLIQIIDVEDTINMGASGTNKKITAGLAANQFANLLTSIPTIIQTELNTKADEVNPSFSGNVILPVGTSIGPVTSAQIGYLDGVTGPIQTQLDGKISAVNSAFTGTATFSNSVAQSLTEGALHCNATAGAILMDDGGHKRISWNDGTGNFNIRAGHYTKTGDIEVYAKSPSDLNSGGATKITFATDASNGNITLSAAAIGTPGNAVTWGNNFVLNKDSAHTDKLFGIGTSTPVDTLDANGSAVLRGNSTGAIMFAPKFGTSVYGANYDRFEIYVDPSVQTTTIGNAHGGTGVARSLGFKTANSVKMTITTDGKVGIGKSNPATALDVNGTVTATSFSGAFSGSFTGNAATSTLATKASTLSAGGADGTAMTFTWTAGSGAQPAWLWGGNSSDSITLWNPSNFSVNYATSAGSAGTATTATTATTVPNGAITPAKLSGAQSGDAPIFGVRAWVNFNGIGTTGQNMTIRGSGNVSSVNKLADGRYRVTFVTAMQDANYATIVGDDATSPHSMGGVTAQTTTYVDIAYSQINTSTARNSVTWGQVTIIR